MKSPRNITLFTESAGQQSIVFHQNSSYTCTVDKHLFIRMLDICQKKIFAILKASVQIKLSFKGQKLKYFDVHSFTNCEITYFNFLDNFQYRRICQKTKLTSRNKIFNIREAI